MNLKELVGKMAIRTAEQIVPEFGSPVITGFAELGEPKIGQKSVRKYMDEPVRIINVKEEQVVIEDQGVRKLLEREFVDKHWTDYDKFMYPEREEQEKLENISKEIKAATEPLRRFLANYYDPMVKVVVENDRVVVEIGEFQAIFWEEEEIEENE